MFSCSNENNNSSQESLKAQNMGIRIGWLEPYPTKHIQTQVAMCQELSWIVNINKSKMEQIFNFTGNQCNL